jgi:hypothetical protein
MAIYYLASEHLIPAYTRCDGMEGMDMLSNGLFEERREYYLDRGMSLPANYRIANLDGKTSIHVVFFDVDHGHFLIKTSRQANAYAALRALDAFFFLASGNAPDLDRMVPRLLELDHVPTTTWKCEDVQREVSSRNDLPDATIRSWLYSGGRRCIPQDEMRLLGPYVEAIYKNRSLAEALNHLGHSRFLFNGYMVGSYYQCHYRHDRSHASAHDMRNAYFENRERYELAFVSAFKGLERFLSLNQIKKNNVERAVIDLRSQHIQPTTTYQRRHEVFSGHPKKIPYLDLIMHFLDIRNTVAAHANPSPPKKFWISEDNLMEIQLFLKELCSKRLDEVQPRELPKRAVLDFSVGKANLVPKKQKHARPS